MKPLTPAQRQFLKGLAHSRQPVVMIGNQGLTAAVLKEIERGLDAHELIKIKAASDEPDTRRAWLEEICTTTGAAPVQQIGKILVIYRAAGKPVIVLPG
ncbi:MAG: YhbY family RNA-binding protein [Rhizobium sp.]|jgi:RNA-binding protein|uniref:YhbY family RNA-binding protein n=1 Tax=Thiobacillus sp. TaxID=924 RepID=UPI0025F06397|nr:YhbY family RNA-binding protein [Thiobacillus sp.]MBW8364420.1 YhbY family RNA-binding protein [Rhizobium sp.]